MASLPLKDAYVIVTGGSRGIGYEAAKGLMAQGAHVVIAGRNAVAAQAAADRLRAQGLPGTCATAMLDLEDPASIRLFVKGQQSELAKLGGKKCRVLVNNAGVMGVGYTPDGFDRHVLCNHLGPFLLTQALKPSLEPGARIVNVASRAHYFGKLDFTTGGELLCVRRPAFWWPRYSNSKLANVVFTAELQRQSQQWGGIKAVSVSPGFVATTLFDSLPWPLNVLSRPVVPLIARTPAQGAETVVWAASSPDVTGLTQQVFLHDCKPLAPLAAATDPQLGRTLWDWSERMVAAWEQDGSLLTDTGTAGSDPPLPQR